MNRQTLHLALVELKNRGFMSIELSDQELDEWLTGLVEVKTRAAAAGDRSAAEDARELSSSGGIIRFETFRNAVEFAEEKGNHGRGWEKMSRKEILTISTHKYGDKWRPQKAEESNTLKKLIISVLQGSLVGLLVVVLPSYYIIPWYVFRFEGDKFAISPAKKMMLKRSRIAGKRSEYFS